MERKSEIFWIIVIFILAISIVVYNSNSDNPTNDINGLEKQITYLVDPFIESFEPVPQEQSYGLVFSNLSVGKISNGYWYVNVTAFAPYDANYSAMYIVWYDSSGKVLGENLGWNKTNLKSQQSYSISSISHLKSNVDPSKIKILFFDSPTTNYNDSNAYLSEEFGNSSISWLG